MSDMFFVWADTLRCLPLLTGCSRPGVHSGGSSRRPEKMRYHNHNISSSVGGVVRSVAVPLAADVVKYSEAVRIAFDGLQ